MNTTRKSYPSDVTDAEWEFLTPYLTLMREDAPQREHSLRDGTSHSLPNTGVLWTDVPASATQSGFPVCAS